MMESTKKSFVSTGFKADMAFSAIFGKLKANIDFSFVNKKNLCLLVTSALPDEGKTTIAVNTAAIMAASGKKTLLIDADMRSASVHLVFNQPSAQGLSDIISRNADWHPFLIKATHNLNLYIITSGRKPMNSTKFISSEEFCNFLESVKREFDYVILDTPPILVFPDSQIISPLVDGVILVVRSGKTSSEAVRRAGGLLRRANANLIGSVLNYVKTKDSGYAYGHGYQHYEDSGSNNRIPYPVKPEKMNNDDEPEAGGNTAREDEAVTVPQNIYRIICRPGSELAAAGSINKNYPELHAIAPVKTVQEKRQGHWEKREQILLPGYVFLYTGSTLPIDLRTLVDCLNQSIDFEKGMKKLSGGDADFAEWVYRHGGVIGASLVRVREGHPVQAVDGPLQDFRGTIVRMDRHKRHAEAVMDIDGEKRTLYFGAECDHPEE